MNQDFKKVRKTLRKRLFNALDALDVNYVLYSELLPDTSQSGNDIDLIVDPASRVVFFDVISQFEAATFNTVRSYMNKFIVHEQGFLFSIDVRWGAVVCIAARELWSLPFPNISDRIKLVNGGYRHAGDFLLPFLAALYCSIDKDIYAPDKESWNGKNRKKWLVYFDAFVSEVRNERLTENLNMIKDYSRSGYCFLTEESWYYILKKSFTVRPVNFSNDLRFRLMPGMAFVVLVEGADGSGKSTLIRTLQHRWPLSLSQLYLGYGDHGWKFSTARRLALNPSVRLRNYPLLLAILQTFIVLPIEFLRRQIGVSLQAGRSLVLIDRMPLKILGSRNWLVNRIYKYVLPNADLIVLLHGDPKIISGRKPQEVTPAEVAQLTEEAEEVLSSISGVALVKIDTSAHTVDQAADNALLKITERMGGFTGLCKKFRLEKVVGRKSP